jgi:hypothetical protein
MTSASISRDSVKQAQHGCMDIPLAYVLHEHTDVTDEIREIRVAEYDDSDSHKACASYVDMVQNSRSFFCHAKKITWTRLLLVTPFTHNNAAPSNREPQPHVGSNCFGHGRKHPGGFLQEPSPSKGGMLL